MKSLTYALVAIIMTGMIFSCNSNEKKTATTNHT